MQAITRYRTGDQALVRQMNLSVILHPLRKDAPISRARLAEITGLNKTTVSSLVKELIEREFVREEGLKSTGTGRPATLLSLDPMAGCIISAEIGVDFISVIATDFAPEIIWRQQDQIRPEMGQGLIMDRALALLNQALAEGNLSCKQPFGVAIGVPGLVDQFSGELIFAPNLGWKNVPIRDLLLEALGSDIPIFVDNEANMAALGEQFFGAAQGYEEVLYISAGVGLGGGIVHGGRLFSGATGVGSEFGHMTMNPKGELCNCGNRGCWETQVSQRALFRYLKQNTKGHSSALAKLINGDADELTVSRVVELARLGDATAVKALERIGHNLGIGVASLVNALNPELVVFGGILSLASDFLLPCVDRELRRRALQMNREATRVVRAHHGFDACVMGGVATVYQTVLAAPGDVRNHGM